MAPFLFSDWARIINPAPGLRLVAVLGAYFDLSETHRHNTGITSVAGYVATDEVWSKVIPKWQAALDYWGLDYFHLSALKDHPNVGQEKYDLCLGYFKNVIKTARLHPIGAALYDNDWHQPVWADKGLTRLGSPYEQCLDMALRVLGDFTNTHVRYKGQRVAVVADPDKDDTVIRPVFNNRKQQYPQFISLTTDSHSVDILPLQFADLGTGLLRQNWIGVFEKDSKVAFGHMPGGGMGQNTFWSYKTASLIASGVIVKDEEISNNENE